MRFFDAHCDTIQKIVEKEADFLSDSQLHITLPGLRAANVCCQVFATWVWGEKYKGREFDVALGMIGATRALCEASPDELVFASSAADITRASTGDSRTAIVAGLEGADALQGEADRIVALHQAGIRILTVAWGDSPFCGSVFGDGSGLTGEGRELIGRCEDLGVLVDVSHASDQAFEDVLRVARKPLVASHSNCRSVCANSRNLSDDMIRGLANAGGVLGINLGSGFLSADFFKQEKGSRDEFFRTVNAGEKTFEEAWKVQSAAVAKLERPSLDWVVQHVQHAIKVGGEDCVGLGGDLDGVESLPLGLDRVDDYPKIAELLVAGGVSSSQLEKVCYRNFARVFGDVLR
jgi:membrane dipeptidase